MDRNKRIAGIVFAGIVALAITACRVQLPGYVSLYVDNSPSVYDTIEPGEWPVDMMDTTMTLVVDTTAGIEAELPVFLRPSEDLFKISSDRAYQHEVNELLKAVEMPVAEGWQTDPMTLQLIRAKDEQIQMLQNRLNALQAAATTAPQQTHILREPAQAQPFGSHQTDLMSLQLIKAKDDQIQMLQNRLNAMQAAATTAPQQTQIIREPAQAQLPGSQQNDPLTLQLLQAKNDTILFLRSQLHNLGLQSPTKDTFIVENEGIEMQPAKELVSKQETSDLFRALQDSMQLLKNMVLSLEEYIIPVMDTTALSSQDKIDIHSPAITDTNLLVAYYELGEIKPLKEEAILKQIKELCSNKSVTKIALSGYTDSSGNELINKEITNTRLNYLLEIIIQWIAKEKVFLQNFGDAFASDSVVMDERRTEIRIHTK